MRFTAVSYFASANVGALQKYPFSGAHCVATCEFCLNLKIQVFPESAVVRMSVCSIHRHVDMSVHLFLPTPRPHGS
jgi:hypothetical protein